MRYPASEKLEIIQLVEQSHLLMRRPLEKLGIFRPTFYRWYAAYQAGGTEALEDHKPRPERVWNRIPGEVRERVLKLALDEPTLSPRELAVRFTDTERYHVSESSAYSILKAHDLITSSSFIVVNAADEFKDKVRRIREQSSGLFFRQTHRTSSGRPTSPTWRSPAGADSTCPQSLTTSPATSSPGSCVRP
jgi:putative transposase